MGFSFFLLQHRRHLSFADGLLDAVSRLYIFWNIFQHGLGSSKLDIILYLYSDVEKTKAVRPLMVVYYWLLKRIKFMHFLI